MLRLSIAGLRAHLVRTLLTVAAVALGVAFLAGTLVYADTARAGFTEDFARAGVGVDVAVNPPDQLGYPRGATLTAADLARVRALPGVATADGRVVTDLAVLDHTGRAISDNRHIGYAVSVPDPAMSPVRLVDGALPDAPGTAALDQPTARRLGLRPGDPVSVLDPADHPVVLRLVGVVDYGAGPIFTGSTVVMLTPTDLGRLAPGVGYTTLVVRTDGTDPGRVRDEATAALPGWTVVTGDDLRATLAHDSVKYVGGFLAVLLAGTLVALVVACLVVHNTFAILAAQRARELALLRCVGASRGQVVTLVLTESALVGLVAAGAGVALSLLVAPLISLARNSFGAPEPAHGLVVSPVSLAVGLGVGTLATVAAGLLPALSASRIPPLAALRTAVPTPDPGRRIRIVRSAGAALLGSAGAIVMAHGTRRGFDGVVEVIGGGMVVFVGLVVVLPVVITPLTRLVGWLPVRVGGVPTRLAVANAGRHPTRVAAATSALMVGIALTSLFTVVLSTARDQSARELAENFPIDFQLDAVSHGRGDDNLPATLDRDLRASGAFDVVVRSRLDYVWTADGEQLAVAALQPATGDTPTPLPVEVMRGSLADLGPGTIAVRTRYAYAHDIAVGDTLPITSYGGGAIPARVVAIYDDAPVQGDLLMAWSPFAQYLGPRGDQILLRHRPGIDATTAEQALDRVLTAYPLVAVTSQADRREQLTLGLQQRLTQFGALLGLSTVIAILGIMDTLALSVLERAGESSLLRALGLSRRQLRRTLVLEAILMSVVGGVLGAAFGVGVGWLTAASLIQAYGHGGPSVPVLVLAGYVAAAAAAGALASLLPARSLRLTAPVQ